MISPTRFPAPRTPVRTVKSAWKMRARRPNSTPAKVKITYSPFIRSISHVQYCVTEFLIVQSDEYEINSVLPWAPTDWGKRAQGALELPPYHGR